MLVWSPTLLLAQRNSGNELLASTKTVTSHETVPTQLVARDSPDTLTSQEVALGDYQVQVGFRSVDEKEVASDVSFVNMQAVLDNNYITYPLDGMEAFVGGFNGNLWGQSNFLILVDGVPRDLGSMVPTEIEQITFLKGANAIALYGSLAARGVILVTTKRGRVEGQSISVRANAGVYVPKSYPKFLGSAEYMTLYNEARANDGLDALYSDEQIYHHAAGVNPYRYPDVDYYSSDYIKPVYSRYDATVEIEGGNEKTRYYTNLGFYRVGSQLDFGEAVNNQNKRFNIRGNVDMNLNEYLSAFVDASAVFYNGVGVNTNYWQGASTLRPNRFAPLIPVSLIEDTDGASQDVLNASDNIINNQYLLGGSQIDQTNPIADIYAGGTNNYNSRQFQFRTGFNADLGSVLEGLSFNTRFGVDLFSTYNESFNNEYAVYQPVWTNYSGDDLIGSLNKIGQDARTGDQNISASWYRQTLSFSGQLNYQRSSSAGHNFSAIALVHGFQRSISSEYHKPSNANLGLHFGYDFQGKYYAAFDGAYIHSAKLPESNRQALSPTFNLGWRISEESFLRSSSVIDNLKLSVSGGIINTDLDITNTDNEGSDYFLYENLYRQTDGAWYSWSDGLSNQSTDSRRGANPNLDFVQRREISLGLEASLLDNAIVFSGSFFRSETAGIVIQNYALFPSYFRTGFPNSDFVPYTNSNNDERTGVDLNLRLNQSIGELELTLGVSGLYYEAVASKRDELNEDAYQNRQGQPLDAIWGLENLGFFADQADIDNSPSQQAFGEVRPGDLKYRDQNGDGIINVRDEVYLGRAGWSGSPLTMGVNLTARWKNLTLFALGTVRSGAYSMRNGNYFWVDGEDKYSEIVRGRWTPETSQTATYPRLTSLNSDNNFRNSDFWLYSTNRFDLSRVQLSYDFPETALGANGFVKELGVYVNGTNLLTISPNRDLLELNIGSAPQTRFFNLGVRAMF